MGRDIFVSYSQPDRDCAVELTQRVEAEGLSVWIAPRDVSPGADWATEIIDALSDARIMVLVFSASTNDSPQVRREVERAVHKQLLILPFRIEDVEPSKSLEYFLSAEHWLDAFPPPRQPYYAQLCAHLKRLMGGTAATVAAPAVPAAAGHSASPLAPSRSGGAARIGSTAGAGAARSVAVLPFANLSSDPEQEYFSDGLSEELIHQLANLKGLHVAGRTSSFSFKGKQEDLRIIGEKLGVRHLLEGSVRKAGNRLRITAQLVSCTDGYHLWSETFDRTLDDLFAIQDDIARLVARALSVTLGVGQVLALGGTRSVEAYDLYLRARSHFRLMGAAELERAAGLYRAAIAIDPGFALAWAGLADTMVSTMVFSSQKSDPGHRALEQALERAMALEPDLWSSHSVSGIHKRWQHKWWEAEQAARKAVELAPASEWAPRFHLAAGFMAVGRIKESIPLFESARQADPLVLNITTLLQITRYSAGDEAGAEAEYRLSQGLEGEREGAEEIAVFRALGRGASLPAIREQMRRYLSLSTIRMRVLHDLLDALDRPDVARVQLRQAFEDPENREIALRQFKIAMWAAQFDDADLALAAARRAYVELRSPLVQLIWTPPYRKVRRDPRFKELLRDLGIVDYWRETGKWGDFVRPVGHDDFEVS